MAKPVKVVSSGITQMQMQRGWKKRTEPGTDQLRRCGSDRAGSADRSTFVSLDTEEKEKRRKTAQRDGEKESVRKNHHPVFLFQVSSRETATRTRVSGRASVQYSTAAKSRPSQGAGIPLRHVRPSGSSFKERVRLRQKHTPGKKLGRKAEAEGGERWWCVTDR